MAALVQSYPQQSGSVTMLHTRPGSASGIQGQNQPYGGNQPQRNSYYGGSGGQPVYRMNAGPIQPYAFTTTPTLHSNNQWQNPAAYRTASSPAVPTMRTFGGSGSQQRGRYPGSVSMTNLPSSSYGEYGAGSRDDSSLPAVGGRRYPSAPRPQSAHLIGATTATATQVTFTQATPVRLSPERYRRPAPRNVDGPPGSAGRQPLTPPQFGDQRLAVPRNRTPSNTSRPNSFYSSTTGSSTDDLQLYRQQLPDEQKRLRRRSMPALDSAEYRRPFTPQGAGQSGELAGQKGADLFPSQSRLTASNGSHGSKANVASLPSSNGSSESLNSNRSNGSIPSSANRNPGTPTANPAGSNTSAADQSANSDPLKVVTIPPRGSSSDASKTVNNPSPLSKPVTMDLESDAGAIDAKGDASNRTTSKNEPPAQAQSGDSPAVQRLAAISKNTGRSKSKTSRLRRAFSFGSAADFKKAADEHEASQASQTSTPSTKLHKEPPSDTVYDAEQARIAQQQEEAGIGSNIYAGAKIFSNSTDNLSISSTASSASIMIRKMGRGMKKGGRSLVGLFRPKSMIGAPMTDSRVPQAGQAEVSMITAEAEREKVNVTPNPRDQAGGGVGFPRLERNSIDASKVDGAIPDHLGVQIGDQPSSRRSIIGGDKERAEALASVRTKGILKRRGSPSPPRGNGLPGVPPMSDSPNSSAPSTPNDDVQAHKRAGSVAIGSEDYFMTALRLRQDTKSAPVTPQGATPTSTLRRNATFSPRIVFYDTWPPQEYDRRGEIATCNRLTPMLAQQIKEELNSFKMEMEVHENSKIYTHFF
ncbi:hypothetical protein PpBr36_00494 [Pyricularia pennisetigena]|uniref:hypothetical protein n=1 Tax=Pyricularia pennisetigena TaxID=1578925 RepID=UPI00115305BA|nr:hypothetical protein PpBr36_00494 [Pyricularia pennisetigena]TLS29290.1 hypothetical protein PpBr36_00494 [Pyricularia pennisetigena]